MTTVPSEQALTEHRGDHDGKSKTSSSVDEQHYPDFSQENVPEMSTPTQEEIAALAHRIWELHGCPQNSADEDWFEAEHELLSAARDRSSVAHIHGDAGSVQK